MLMTTAAGGLSTASPDRAELQVYVYRLSEEKVEEFGGSLSKYRRFSYMIVMYYMLGGVV